VHIYIYVDRWIEERNNRSIEKNAWMDLDTNAEKSGLYLCETFERQSEKGTSHEGWVKSWESL
jgi:hypothetical protein